MPKSKRNTLVSLTKTDKKGKEHKAKLIEDVQKCCDQYKYVWIFEIKHMRTNLLKEVRKAWEGSRIFMGRNAVTKKGLGSSEEDEYRPGTHLISAKLEGDVGLLFTDEEKSVVVEWFESYKKEDYARTGNAATEEFALEEGPLRIGEDVAAHSLEPQFRKLGLSTSLVKGVPTLLSAHVVCKKGETLNPNQVQLLKLFQKPMATFQIVPILGVDMTAGHEL